MKLKKVIKFATSADVTGIRAQMFRLSMIVGILIFGLGVLASYIFSYSIQSKQQEEFNTYKNQTSKNVNDYITNKINSYESLLVSASSHLKIKNPNELTKSDWSAIYEGLQIERRMPEILGFGFSQYLRADQLQNHIQTTRLEIPSYQISPQNAREEYTSIKYIEPFDDLNKRAVGFDMFSEKNRKQAMSKARDTATAQMSAPVISVQDERSQNVDKPQSVLIYYPAYTNNSSSSDIESRRQNLIGYVYFAVRAPDITKTQESLWSEQIQSFSLYDVTDEQKLLHQIKFGPDSEITSVNQQEFKVAGRTWLSEIRINNAIQDTIFTPTKVFVGGLIFSSLTALLIFMLLARRATALRDAHESEIKKTKDELLALASHQLRTPATAVRQYVSMLNGNYFGKLTKQQKSIAEKAFIANERQLEIIDQILYVAKADAGQLILSPEKIDVSKLTHRIIEEFDETLKKKSIKISFNKSKKVLINADERYLSMVIENLISNAIKYSYPDSTIKVRIKKDKKNNVVIRIKDEGVGVANEDLSKLFQKFSRIDNPLSRSEGGSGLGLFLANKLVKAHGGSIDVSSEPGKGSTFEVKLPSMNQSLKNVVQLTES